MSCTTNVTDVPVINAKQSSYKIFILYFNNGIVLVIGYSHYLNTNKSSFKV